ncbi:ornithine cyclodeaminase family protein [Patulibacter sp. SYSU D01012]|uniref:ornithine cyclodeaminase family protein n=1 Tax=Patulibacter sp. SYSU D01012 TaxID=2817381 RepID=UPI001B301F93|nr:ornithine cyclodeaminase family protein [Patulibacter sp. SYSU D01012]
MPTVPVLNHDAVLAAVSPAEAVQRTADAFRRHHAGEWTMPSKVYLQAPPAGDFRAMPALGDGVAMLKWISSFPGNPAKGLATVQGVVVLSDAETSVPLAMLDARAVTALRTGAVAAVAAQALAPAEARTVGIVGSGLHGTWAARCLAAVGYDGGVAADPRPEAAQALADELGRGAAAGGGGGAGGGGAGARDGGTAADDGGRAGAAGGDSGGAAWRAGSREEALAQDVVCCVTPGGEPVVDVRDLRPGLHLNMLGADGPGKQEATVDAVARCALFCDEWAQASHGGELTAGVEAGAVTRDAVTDLGAVLAGDAPGRPDDAAVTLFDSTGLAIQDLAIGLAAFAAWREGRVQAQTVEL